MTLSERCANNCNICLPLFRLVREGVVKFVFARLSPENISLNEWRESPVDYVVMKTNSQIPPLDFRVKSLGMSAVWFVVSYHHT